MRQLIAFMRLAPLGSASPCHSRPEKPCVLGQLITSYPLSRLIAEMTLQENAAMIADRGFRTHRRLRAPLGAEARLRLHGLETGARLHARQRACRTGLCL